MLWMETRKPARANDFGDRERSARRKSCERQLREFRVFAELELPYNSLFLL